MEKNILDKIIEDFNNKEPDYNDLAIKAEILLNSLIKKQVVPHQIQWRVKDQNSLTQKIIKKNYKYSNLEEITDILGFRIITYFEDDIDTIEKIILNELEIDTENSIDKRNIEVDRFGYKSVHYVVSINRERLKLTEYKHLSNLKFEIQVRSILQHSWAEIEHDIGYKGVSEIPLSAKRTFYRVAALLEQADIEFTKLRQEIREVENKINLDLKNNKTSVELDKSSLIAFIKNSTVLSLFEREVETQLDCRCINDINNEKFVDSNLIDDFVNLNIKNIVDLENSLVKHRDAIITEQADFFKIIKKHKIMNNISFGKGAPILWLRNYLKQQK